MPPTPPSNAELLLEREGNHAGQAIPVIDSAMLLCGRREVIIQHGTGNYRLRVTASNKLILTK